MAYSPSTFCLINTMSMSSCLVFTPGWDTQCTLFTKRSNSFLIATFLDFMSGLFMLVSMFPFIAHPFLLTDEMGNELDL